MESKSEQKHASNGASSPVGNDLAVQPVDIKSVVPVDGPVIQTGTSSAESVSSASDNDASSVAEVAVSETSPAAPIAVDAEDNDTFDDTAPVRVEPEATDDTIAGEDNDDPETVSGPTITEATVVDAEKHDGNVTDACSGSVERVAIQDIKGAAPSSIEPEATPDIIADQFGDDRETVLEQSLAAPTVPNTENNNAVGKDAAFGSVEREATASIGAPAAPKPAGSVPPHWRPSGQPSANPQARYADIPRAPRNSHATNNSFRGFDGREEAARLSAQIMKVRNELDAERKKSLNMRSSIEQELQKTADAALAQLTTELFHKQIKTLAQQGKLEAKERDLLFREAQIEQIEIFLSEGQKQVYRQANVDHGSEEATLSMAEVKHEHKRRQAELAAQKNMSDREGTLSMRDKALQLREAAQMMREQQYKALIRGALEAERRDDAMPDMEAKLDEVADPEYNRGFGAGKVAGRAAADRDVHDRSFLEGYSAARVAELALNKLKMGSIARDSPELDFLYNSSHPYNLFTMGARVGGMDTGKEKTMTNGTQDQGERKPVANVAPVQAENRPAQEQRRPEEAVRRLPPPRATFAAELRGASNMHNGQPVLANGPSSSPPHDGVYEGRKVVKHEEVEGESLIDLY